MLEIWLLRGAGALAVGDRELGQDAAQHLLRLANQSQNATAEKLIKALWAKGWIKTNDLNLNLTARILEELLQSRASPPNSQWSINERDDGYKNEPSIWLDGPADPKYYRIVLPLANVAIESKKGSGSDYYCQIKLNGYAAWRFSKEMTTLLPANTQTLLLFLSVTQAQPNSPPICSNI